MKLINKTDYDSRVIRSILCAVHTKQSSWGRGRLRSWGWLEITVTYTKPWAWMRPRAEDRIYVTGWATLTGCRMRLHVPREACPVDVFTLVVRHELWHSYGIEHPDMPPSVMSCDPKNETNAAWVAEFVERFGTSLEKKIDNRHAGDCNPPVPAV